MKSIFDVSLNLGKLGPQDTPGPLLVIQKWAVVPIYVIYWGLDGSHASVLSYPFWAAV